MSNDDRTGIGELKRRADNGRYQKSGDSRGIRWETIESKRFFINIIEGANIRIRLGMNPQGANEGVGETPPERIVRAIDPDARKNDLQCRRMCSAL